MKTFYSHKYNKENMESLFNELSKVVNQIEQIFKASHATLTLPGLTLKFHFGKVAKRVGLSMHFSMTSVGW